MLLEFRVSNFRSFRDEAALSLVTSNDEDHPDNLLETQPMFWSATVRGEWNRSTSSTSPSPSSLKRGPVSGSMPSSTADAGGGGAILFYGQVREPGSHPALEVRGFAPGFARYRSAKGSMIATPVRATSVVFRVTSVNPCTFAVAASSPSTNGS